MADMVDIKVIIDEKYIDPLVNIYTKSKTDQVDNIIYAIENSSHSKYPPIPVTVDNKYMYISQRDIYSIKTMGRKVSLETVDNTYVIRGTMARFEEELDSERFFRISQSEIINLYKVDYFDFSVTGTIGVVFDNGTKSFVARRCVKPLRDKLKSGL